MEHLNWTTSRRTSLNSEIPTGSKSRGENELPSGFAEVRCTLGWVCESIVHPVTHVIILLARYLPAPPSYQPLLRRTTDVVGAFRVCSRGPRIEWARRWSSYWTCNQCTRKPCRSGLRQAGRLFENPETAESRIREAFERSGTKKRLEDLGILIFPRF